MVERSGDRPQHRVMSGECSFVGVYAMKRIGSVARFLAGVVVLAAVCGCGICAAADNLLQNAGFEAVEGGRISAWSTPEYWSGATASVEDSAAVRSETRAARLTAAKTRGSHWGRVLQSVRTGSLTGRRFRYSVWAKGEGEFLLGCIEYRSAEKYKPHYKYRWQAEPVNLGAEWREVVFEFSVPDPAVRRLAVVAEVRGEDGNALLDDASLVRFQEPGIRLRVSPSHAMVAAGRAGEIGITVEKDGEPLESGELTILTLIADEEPVSTVAEISADGVTVHRFDASAGVATGSHRLVIAHPASGAVAECYLDVVDRQTWAGFAAAAERARVAPLPAHLLFIGDSLTDQQRGYNYVDKLAFWLQSSQGADGLTYRNSGVGGDFISRVWQRMNGDPKVHRPGMYDDLFDPRPTHVFFFLGHNDSKLSSRSGFTQQCVDPKTFEEEYRLAIEKVQRETGAKVIVISATSSVYEICKTNSDRRLAAGTDSSLFGKPEELERFNAIARRVAGELGADYVDVYESTRADSDKPSLFNPRDGVHLTNEGNRFIALELLKYFDGQ